MYDLHGIIIIIIIIIIIFLDFMLLCFIGCMFIELHYLFLSYWGTCDSFHIQHFYKYD